MRLFSMEHGCVLSILYEESPLSGFSYSVMLEKEDDASVIFCGGGLDYLHKKARAAAQLSVEMPIMMAAELVMSRRLRN